MQGLALSPDILYTSLTEPLFSQQCICILDRRSLPPRVFEIILQEFYHRSSFWMSSNLAPQAPDSLWLP